MLFLTKEKCVTINNLDDFSTISLSSAADTITLTSDLVFDSNTITLSGFNGTTSNDLVWSSSPNWTGHPYGGSLKVGESGKISIQGDDADIDINGKSMKAWMEKVEERLNILTPNPELEKEWDDLRRLGERYRKLEKKCKEKSEVWNKLKAMPPIEVD